VDYSFYDVWLVWAPTAVSSYVCENLSPPQNMVAEYGFDPWVSELCCYCTGWYM